MLKTGGPISGDNNNTYYYYNNDKNNKNRSNNQTYRGKIYECWCNSTWWASLWISPNTVLFDRAFPFVMGPIHCLGSIVRLVFEFVSELKTFGCSHDPDNWNLRFWPRMLILLSFLRPFGPRNIWSVNNQAISNHSYYTNYFFTFISCLNNTI